jgi:hypothetical protein
MSRWPGTRVLVLRKTRVSLNDSWLDTFENEVLFPSHPAVGTLQRQNRTRYTHENGSELILAGMDQKRRLFSTQYHIIYVNEMTELTEQEWMSLHRALRRPGGPGWHLLIGDANPDAEFHWANRRFPDPMPYGKRRATRSGRMRILSWHKDNPMLSESEQGRQYLHRLDKQLVGHMRDRLFLGLWRTASGLIYPMYNSRVHLQTGRLAWQMDAFDKPLRGEPVTLELPDLGYSTELNWFDGGVDFGWTKPGALEIWGHDSEKRGFRTAEVYRKGKDLDWWGDWVADLYEEFRMRYVVADSAEPRSIEHLNDHLAERGVPRIVRGVEKPKRKIIMFNAVREAMRAKHDGVPSFFLLRDSLRGGRDPDLDNDSMPCTLEEEIPGLVVASPRETERGEVHFEEEDEACPNHGCDAAGYEHLEAWKKDLSKRKDRPERPIEAAFEALKESAYDLAKKERLSRGEDRD